ncbi:MAG: FadR family transcriptional regulator [Hyphomicrobiales bacterium]|nr:FadR family transcriptional regulator [Hyphomicrobiales bacterium]
MPSSPLFEQVHQQLLEKIRAGIYPAGGRLPGEWELAESFGVSRPVVRQALMQLRAEGTIRSKRGSGTFVSDTGVATGLDFGNLTSVPDVQKCLEFRSIIECEAAAIAATVRSSAELQEVGRRMRQYEKVAASNAPSTDEDFAFHMAITKSTGNRFLIITLQALKQQIIFGVGLIQSLAATSPEENAARVTSEHAAILSAIKSNDTEAARSAMRAHLDAGVSRLFEK